MTDRYPSDSNTTSVDTLRAALHEAQPALYVPDDDTDDGYNLLVTLHSAIQRLDADMDELYEQRFIETATTEELERLGANVGVDKRTGESETKYRRRVEAGYIVATSTGTYGDIAEATLRLLDTDASKVTLRRAADTADPATCVLEIEGTVIDDSPFTKSEIADELTDAVVGGHRITVQRRDVFTWDDSSRGWGTQWGNPTS